MHFFISLLTTWLRARCFSEPTFRSSGATNHWKNTMFRDFPTFSRTCIFFLLTLSLLLSSLFSSLTLPTSAFPSVHIVGSLTSKLPSIRCYQSVWKEHFAAQNLGNPKLVPFCLPPSRRSNSSAYLNGAAFKLRKFTTPCRASEDFVTWSRLSVPYSSMSNLHKQAHGRSDQ